MKELRRDISLSNLEDFAKEVLETYKTNRIFSFYGEMGVGKTTLISKLVKLLTGEEASSPTFSLVNVYKGERTTVNHFDCYRIENSKDIESIGYEEYFYSGDYCFIEWPEKIETLIPQSGIKVYLSVHSKDEIRSVIIKT
jgi:tRNA threonylcarbamoyladenosine biosynthesis protein TsaE